MPKAVTPPIDASAIKPEPKLLYRRLDRLFGAWKIGRPPQELLETFLEEFFSALKEPLRIKAAVLYGERRESFAFLKQVGAAGAPSEEIERGIEAIGLLSKHRVYIFNELNSKTAPSCASILPPGDAAGIMVGKRPYRHAFFFLLEDGWMREELDFALNTVRAALGSRLMEERVRGSFAEAAEIQQSLLLEDAPDFPGYDIACRSIPAEEVGGDFFDFMPFDRELLAVSIGDASGHGMPAALLVRDVVTGLRMGFAKDMKIAPVFEKLNEVIHRSNLSSRFVSVFYGELETNGNLFYVNAGHQSPLLFLKNGITALTTGGTVIGPLPSPRFKRGFAHVDRGATLVMTTDGIIERRNSAGDFFGEERLKALIQENLHQSAEALLSKVFDTVVAWGSGGAWEDDATLVVIKRLEARPKG
ncbi:MAG: PP2C family protein-serine/threonine phosphatase [Vicinamibacteria bacterium]|jgi:sigma-B regulation protein RsbU (phosphoserine phosphatase)|nr:PP2C family protein-serine/threonine phosphatase [Vicinamibacteria bacterium]